MNNNIKLEAQNYIKNNCRYYKNYFCTRDMNTVVKHAMEILERNFLKINSFCYYVDYSLTQMFLDSNYCYNVLTSKKRNQLDCYKKAMTKILMHLNLIFVEINNINNCIKNNKRWARLTALPTYILIFNFIILL